MSTEEQRDFDALEEEKTQVLTFTNAVDFSKSQFVICLFTYREL